MKILSLIAIVLFTFTACDQSQTAGKVDKVKVEKLEKEIEAVPVLPRATTFSFNSGKNGELPEYWSEYFTGKGAAPKWRVVTHNGEKVFAQLSSEQPNYHFNVAVFDGFKAKNMTLKVKMKGVRGKKDQGGGFVWRFLDKDNYYVVRANPLEDNVVLYKVVNGERTDLPVLGEGRTYGVKVPFLGQKWNNLELKVVDDLFTVFLNGKRIFQVQDDTFTGAGKVGLWTKADAVSYFDDFEAIPAE